MRNGRAVVAAVAGAGLMLLAVPSMAAAMKPTKGPGGLAFYDPPNKLPKGHGKLVWQRKAGGLVPLKAARRTRNVLYTSKTPAGKHVAASGTIATPRGKAPKGGWPVVSYAHGTTGTADVCAPSRTKRKSPAADYVTYVYPRLNQWLRAGYAVALTDYLGLGTPGPHQYLIGEAEGRGVLDIVRAARKLDRRIGRRFLIAGHSQGGHAALFAAGLAKRWTPDLKHRGTVAYAPASHLKEQGDALPALTEPNGLSGLVALIVEGALTETPGSDAAGILSDEALAFYPLVRRECAPQLGAEDAFGSIAPSEMLRDGADTGPLLATLAEQNPAVKNGAPILLAQGSADSTVFQVFSDLLDGELRELGNKVDYRIYEGVTHGGIVDAAKKDVIGFFGKRLPARAR